MRILKKLCLVFALIMPILLSGCTNFDTEVSLDKNGNSKVEINTKTPDTIATPSYIEEKYEIVKEKYEDYGDSVEVSKISQNGGMGIKVTAHTNDFNKNDIFMPDCFEPTNDNKRFITVKHNIFSTKYSINWKFHLDEIDGEMLTSVQQSMIDSTLKINIPVKASSSNADKRNDMTNSYEWDFDSTKVNDILLEYSIINWVNIIIFVLLIINAIILTIFILKKSDKKHIIYTIIPMVILILYISVSMFICVVNNNINKSPLPINYYKIAKDEGCPECIDGQVVDDYAAVKVNDKYGLVNKQNEFIVKAENKYVENLDGDYCLVCKEDKTKCAYFNKETKKYLTEFKYTCNDREIGLDIEDYIIETSTGFFEGLARVVINDHEDIKMGFINSKGEEVIKPQYRVAGVFDNGKVQVKDSLDSKPYYIDKNGQRIKEEKTKEVTQDEPKEEVTTEKVQKTEPKVSTPKQTAKKAETPKQITPAQKSNVQKQNSDVDDFMN